MKNNLNIAIIGFGRFGALLAEILLPYGKIHIISQQEIASKYKKINYEDLKKMDWIIPAVPIRVLEEVLEKIEKNAQSGSLIMDVCSVKSLPGKWMKKIISSDKEILGSHPMFGPDSAKKGLASLQIIFTPLKIKEETYSKIKKIFTELGLEIIETSPEEHDRQAAVCLSLVHFIGRGLGQMKIKKLPITTLGFERLLKVNETVSNDTWDLFIDMHRFNPYAKKIRENFLESLKNIEEKILNKKEI